MIDTESVSRAFICYTGPKLLGVLHKAENDIYERLGDMTLEEDAEGASQLAEDVDSLIQAIHLHLGVNIGRSSSSLRASINSAEISPSTSHCFSPYTVSELMSILASLYSVQLDVTIGFSASETDCANKLRSLVQRVLTTFSPSISSHRFSSSTHDSSSLSKATSSADIRLLDVIAQAERISALRNTAPLLPLFDFALLSVKRLFFNIPTGGKKHQQHEPEQQENDISGYGDTVAVMLKAIVVVRIAKRIFSRHALRHLRALHNSTGTSFPHVNLPLMNAITGSPYVSELPESAQSNVDELRSFLLDNTSCSDELMERILFYLTRSSPVLSEEEEEEEEEEEDKGVHINESSIENEFVPGKNSEPAISQETGLPEKRRRISSRGVTGTEIALLTIDSQTKSENRSIEINAVELAENRSSKEAIADDSDMIEHSIDDDGDDDNIPLDHLRNRRPKSVDSNMSASWASVSCDPSSDQGLSESLAAASPCSSSTANGSTNGNDVESSSNGNRRRSARLSSKSKAA